MTPTVLARFRHEVSRLRTTQGDYGGVWPHRCSILPENPGYRRYPYWTQKMTRLCWIFLSIPVVVALTGCGDDSAAIKIGVSIPETTAPTYTLAKQGMIEGEKEYGVKVLWNGVRDAGVKQNLATLETQQIRRMFDEGIQALIFKAVDRKRAYPILKEADSRNVPVIMLDQLLVSINVRGHIAVNETGLGEAAAQYAIERIGYKGNVLVLEESTGAESFRNISLGIYTVLDQYSDKIRVHSRAAPLDANVALDLTDRVLKNYAGNIQAVIAADSTLAVGAVRGCAVARAHRSDYYSWNRCRRGSVPSNYVQTARCRSGHNAVSAGTRDAPSCARCCERSPILFRCRITQRKSFNKDKIWCNPSYYAR